MRRVHVPRLRPGVACAYQRAKREVSLIVRLSPASCLAALIGTGSQNSGFKTSHDTPSSGSSPTTSFDATATGAGTRRATAALCVSETIGLLCKACTLATATDRRTASAWRPRMVQPTPSGMQLSPSFLFWQPQRAMAAAAWPSARSPRACTVKLLFLCAVKGGAASATGLRAAGARRALGLRGGSTTSAGSPPGGWLEPGKPVLTLEAADAMASAALAEARARNYKDISVCVLDTSGRVLVSKTMLGCPRLIPEIARAKAGCAVGTHSSSRALKDKYVPDRTPQLLAMTTMGFASNQPFCAVPGGVLCFGGTGPSRHVVGAIGVSGASADEDEHCAIVGAQAVGLQTEPPRSAVV